MVNDDGETPMDLATENDILNLLKEYSHDATLGSASR